MKKLRTRVILLLSLALALSGCGASTVTADGPFSRQDKKAADFEKMVSLMEGSNFQYIIRTATPSGGRTLQMTSEYTLEAREGIYQAYLPYFGRAFQASYGGDGGIEFQGEPENLKFDRNDKKNTLTLNFVIQGNSDRYSVSMEIGASGYGTLTVSGQKRQSISYYGHMSELKD